MAQYYRRQEVKILPDRLFLAENNNPENGKTKIVSLVQGIDQTMFPMPPAIREPQGNQSSSNERYPQSPGEDDIRSKTDRYQAIAEEIIQIYSERYTCEVQDFEVEYNKRKTKSVYGRYNPDLMKIIIYNHSQNENEEINTLIHEIAHHLQHYVDTMDSGKKLSRPGKSHGVTFQFHYHRLIQLMKETGYYTESYMDDPELKSAIQYVGNLKKYDGNTALKIGEHLFKARKRCREINASFEVFIRDGCGFHRSLAYDYIKAWELGLPGDLGIAQMRFVLRVPELLRDKAIKDILNGVPMDVVKLRYRPDLVKNSSGVEIKPESEDELHRLKTKERQLLQKYNFAKKRRIQLENYLNSIKLEK